MTYGEMRNFCSNDREDLAEPFGYRGFNYATDGKVAVRCPTGDPFQMLKHESKAMMVEKVFKDVDWNTRFVKIPEYNREVKTSECERCKGSGKEKTCPECDGSGIVGFSNEYSDYECSCETCMGGTKKPDEMDCEECNGKGEIDIQTSVRINSYSVMTKLLNKIADLPGIKISQKDFNGALAFKFSGGQGLIMTRI